MNKGRERKMKKRRKMNEDEGRKERRQEDVRE